MTDDNTNTETTAATETEPTPPETEAQTATDEFGDADRAKMSEVVRKERAASKSSSARAEKAETRLAELEANELRRTVAEDKGLSSEQAAFLSGDSAEEMGAAADALLAAFPKGGGRVRSPFETMRTGATGETDPGESVNQVADRVLD